MTLLALGFFGGIALTVVAVVIPGRLLSVPESPGDASDSAGGSGPQPSDGPSDGHPDA
jgi:hypothetical protein